MPLFLFLFILSPLFARNTTIAGYQQAARVMPDIYQTHPYTLYCGCKFAGKTVDLKSCGYKIYKDPKRAARVEWEHIVPAEAFGRSFPEWREGDPKCVKKKRKFKGRKCARTNPEFSRMEADLYNLYPEISELNGLRSNFSMSAFGKLGNDPKIKRFGDCKAIVYERKFEPMDQAKGIVARTYKYMHLTYPGRGIISRKNEKLFEAWNKMYPVTEWECTRAKKIQTIQGNTNPVLKEACKL